MNNDSRKVYWSSDEVRDFHTLVHYTLAFGDLEQCLQLVRENTKEKVRKEFLKAYPGLYSKPALAFAKILLDIKEIEKEKYLKDVYAESIR